MGKREGISLILKNRISQILDFLKMCTSENPTAEIRWSQGTGFTGSPFTHDYFWTQTKCSIVSDKTTLKAYKN